MKRSTEIVTAIVFCSVLAGMLLAFLILPEQDFSSKENRYLSSKPVFSANALLSGTWSKEFEQYLSDQFPARDLWIVMQAGMQRGTGRLDHNGVYFGESLIGTFWKYDEKRLTRNLSAIEAFSTRTDVPVYFVPVPNACEICPDLLPKNAPDRSQSEILAQIEKKVPDAVLVDTEAALKEASDNGATLYYATDHHMTTEGAFYVYTELAEQMGIDSLPESAFTKQIVSTDFTGTLYRKSGAWWTQPDSVERWDADGVSAALTVLPANVRHTGIYDESALDGIDQYSYFAFGNQPLEVIETNADGGRLLLIKDSYAHAVLPFLCCHFCEIHMLDLRYYHGSVQQYLKDCPFDEIAVLYHIGNLTEDTNLPLLLQ